MANCVHNSSIIFNQDIDQITVFMSEYQKYSLYTIVFYNSNTIIRAI